MKSIYIAFGILITVLAVAACDGAKIAEPAPPPYNEPGSIGTKEGDYPLSFFRYPASIRYFMHPEIPSTPACNKTYILMFSADMREVNCTSPYYHILYNEIIDALQSRTSEMQCPELCPQLNFRTIEQGGSCRDNKAHLAIRGELGCYPADAVPPKGLEFPNPVPDPFHQKDPYTKVIDSPFGPSPDYEVCEIGINLGDVIEECPTRYPVYGFIKQYAKSCKKINDYRPYIDKARKKAQRLWARAACRGGCVKQPPKELFVKWDCIDNKIGLDEVYAEVLIDVICDKP